MRPLINPLIRRKPQLSTCRRSFFVEFSLALSIPQRLLGSPGGIGQLLVLLLSLQPAFFSRFAIKVACPLGNFGVAAGPLLKGLANSANAVGITGEVLIGLKLPRSISPT